ncbi:hypothetical protein N7539_004901 [Penicillium diatomitis]|uniref:Uncharacterized protein n=1 Tax=Penicillium diatomitis TaxID=2819901 RepID=A0A9W9X5W8_9EURO|nr:uncharacterized protein N7539_004901 [Penicillium diatomitis]KAJ5484913.1 hypothetical protein N7539_004901 [Penicillium diatomitis]
MTTSYWTSLYLFHLSSQIPLFFYFTSNHDAVPVTDHSRFLLTSFERPRLDPEVTTRTRAITEHQDALIVTCIWWSASRYGSR